MRCANASLMFVGKRAREDESTERAVDPPPRSRTFFNMSTSVPLDGDPVEMTAKVDLGLHVHRQAGGAHEPDAHHLGGGGGEDGRGGGGPAHGERSVG